MFKKALFSLFVLSFIIAPLALNAQSADDIAKLIAKLEQQIAYLKQQLAQLQGNQSGAFCYTFEKNLGVGSGGKAVDALHTILVKEGFSISPLPVSATTGTSYEIEFKKNKVTFTEATAAAVSAFQLKYKNEILTPLGLANPTGYVGPATRAVLNRLYGCKVVPPVLGNLPPVISGVSGPTTLNIGQVGTWTVQASDPENGPLSYSVIWGDGTPTPMTSGESGFPATQTFTQTATFTHAYNRAGSFYPQFFVKDNVGNKQGTGLSVVVGQNQKITVISPNGGEQWVANSVKPITWRYDGATSATKVDLYLQPTMPSCPPGMGCVQVMPQPIVLDRNILAITPYNWIVATDIVNNPISPGGYWMYVCPAGSTNHWDSRCDSSDNYFTILGPLGPTI